MFHRPVGRRKSPKTARYAFAPLDLGQHGVVSAPNDATERAEEGIRSSHVRDRSAKVIEPARGAVPEGTFAVGAGLMVTAVTSYIFIIVAQRGLSDSQYSAFGAFWG